VTSPVHYLRNNNDVNSITSSEAAAEISLAIKSVRVAMATAAEIESCPLFIAVGRPSSVLAPRAVVLIGCPVCGLIDDLCNFFENYGDESTRDKQCT